MNPLLTRGESSIWLGEIDKLFVHLTRCTHGRLPSEICLACPNGAPNGSGRDNPHLHAIVGYGPQGELITVDDLIRAYEYSIGRRTR